MQPEPDAFTLVDLCDLAGVTPRTVRYYVAQGLLTSPSGAGPGARYDGGHLARLRLIRRLQRDHLPLAEIRRRLAALSDSEAIARAEEQAAPPAGSALDYVREALASHGIPSAGPARAWAMPTSPPLSAASVPGPRAPAAAPPRPVPTAAPSTSAGPGSPAPAMVPPSDRAEWLSEEPAAYRATDSSVGRSQWERIALDPDIELHIRRPLARAQARAVDRLLAVARQILQEERS